ncbi:hypothetical protein G9A89_012233 [Geosiphon pyriformis]|nr:hypothetical protein G9A89_012233 [Geosiphon pyriformis]
MSVEFDLLVIPEDTSTNNLAFTPKQPLTSNIPPAIITKNESLATIFPFKFEETAATSLFSGAALEAKPITAMYTDAKVKGQSIKLILDSSSAGSIITKQLMDQLAASARIITTDEVTKTPIGEINNFPFEVNGIVTPIKVLVMETTQYQAFIGNDWLSKVNATANTYVFWPPLQNSSKRETIDQTGERERKVDLGSLPSVMETDDLTWTDNDKSEPTLSWEWEEDKEYKGKGKEEETTQTTTIYNTYTIPQQSTYCRPKLICVDCGKKLLSMGACCGNDEEYLTATRFYCRPCILKCFGRPKQVEKWDNQPCIACGETLLDEEMWNDIPGRGETCDILC